MKLQSIITHLGEIALSEEELKVYFTLVQGGQRRAGQIARILDLPRVRTYRILQSLENKGLVKATISRPMRFSAISPEQFLLNFGSFARGRLAFLSDFREIMRNYARSAADTASPAGGSFNMQIINGQKSILRRVRDLLRSSDDDAIRILVSGIDSIQFVRLIHREISFRTSDRKDFVRLILPYAMYDEKKQFSPALLDPPIAPHHILFEIRQTQGLIDAHLIMGGDRQTMIIRQDLSSAIMTTDKSLFQIVESFFNLTWNRSSAYSFSKVEEHSMTSNLTTEMTNER